MSRVHLGDYYTLMHFVVDYDYGTIVIQWKHILISISKGFLVELEFRKKILPSQLLLKKTIITNK